MADFVKDELARGKAKIKVLGGLIVSFFKAFFPTYINIYTTTTTTITEICTSIPPKTSS